VIGFSVASGELAAAYDPARDGELASAQDPDEAMVGF
jgi:hypothetical protein